ncbi:MAG: glycosyltransferase, partial [Chitinophagaceae bacterium]
HPGIILAGWSDEVEYFMSLSFALVHPSYREGFPNVLLQAGAMHCPVICSRIEGNIDIVEDERTGLIFEVKNEDSLYKRLEFALANPGLLEQYTIQLRKRIEQYYDQPILHSLIHQKYLALLAEKGIPA